MTSPETLTMKLPLNEHSFRLATHTVDSDGRLGSYAILKSEQGAEHFLDRLIIQANGQV
jgi:hypothetical protein